MRIKHLVGSNAPGRYADIVLLNEGPSFDIAHVRADGQLVSNGKSYAGPLHRLERPDWASRKMNLGRILCAGDFAMPATHGRKTMQAAVLRPFHWQDYFLTMELPVADGEVQHVLPQHVTKWAEIDLCRGDG